ncbi:MAG: T9SS type A sorting domain-containing protein, partial [Bacteroidales bacterium]|nr:T9SS type A sorting domain-containing protein [Bacteroidales bacterium]
SSMMVVDNPDPSDLNPSNYVVQYNRSMNGVPWGGFWSALPVPADVTENKYVYVKVWKPRVSPLKFKLEGGPSGNLEIPSMDPQTQIDQWEEIVFDFTEKTGEWNVIAFMPDFEDPMTLTEDITLYFDDIRLMPNPLSSTSEIATRENIQVYPIPATEFVNIKHEKAIRSVEIFDLAGKMVFSENFNNNELKLDLSGIKKGMYLMQITTENQRFSRKLIH